MTKTELWNAFCDRNPRFRDPDARITLTGRGLEKLFSQAWDRGRDAGYQLRKCEGVLKEIFGL